MAIAFVGASTDRDSGAGTTHTFSHTAGSGSDRCLIVGIAYFPSSSQTVTGVTYGGVSMTEVGNASPSGNVKGYMFKLLAPATGANNVVVTYSASVDANEKLAYAMDWTGVGSVSSATTNSATAGGQATVGSITVSSGQVIVDVVGAYWNSNAWAAGSDQTLRAKESDSSVATDVAGSSEAFVSSPATMDYTGGDTAADWYIIAAVLQEPAAGGDIAVLRRRREGD